MSTVSNAKSPYVEAFEKHGVWMPAFDAPDALAERAKVIAKVMNNGRDLKAVADYEIRELHRLAFILEAKNQGWTHYVPTFKDPELEKEWIADIEKGVAFYITKILASPQAASRLKGLAAVVKVFPLTKPQPAFAAHYSAPKGFKPTLQAGLKAVMLFEFWKQREEIRGSYAGLELPTVGELDSAIREKWKWKGDNKELRDARRELGLTGLPRGKSGRPKKQGGKK